MKRVDYDARQYAVYAEARAVDPATVTTWMRTFAAHLPDRRPLTVLDVGSGTGRFSSALAEEFGGPVFGIEPSRGMRQVARRSSAHPAVTYLAGAAERIPLRANSCDAVVLFLVFHHLPDRRAAAEEIARVLRPGGRVFVRNVFSDRNAAQYWHRFFPRGVEIERELFPAVGEVEDVFAAVGLRRLALRAVPVRFAGSLAESAARLRLRAISAFEFLTDDELAEGFAALDDAVANETTPQPIDGHSDLLVLG